MSALLDSSELPQELKYYLPLFCEVVFESPVMRNGGNYYVDTKTVTGVSNRCLCTLQVVADVINDWGQGFV